MKNILPLMLAACVFYACSEKSNNIDVPDAVLKTFDDRFPNATNVRWSKEADSEFEAEFKRNGKGQSSNFSLDGVWIESEIDLTESEIPASVLSTILTQFSEYKIKDIESVEMPGVSTTYEFGLEKGESDKEVVVSQDGKVLRQEDHVKDSENEK